MRRKAKTVRKATRRGAYKIVHAVLPEGPRKRLRGALGGPSTVEEKHAEKKGVRAAEKRRKTAERQSKAERSADKREQKEAKMAERAAKAARSSVEAE